MLKMYFLIFSRQAIRWIQRLSLWILASGWNDSLEWVDAIFHSISSEKTSSEGTGITQFRKKSEDQFPRKTKHDFKWPLNYK